MLNTIEKIEFYFDPICPWTWITSRWITNVARLRNFPIHYRALSLKLLNQDAGNEPSKKISDQLDISFRALRVIEALAHENSFEESAKFYARFGVKRFVESIETSDELVQSILQECGLSLWLDAMYDSDYDASIRDSHDRAMNLSGPDIGSPVITIYPSQCSIFGPIVSPAPDGDEALRIFDATVELASSRSFFELKRGRKDPPNFS